MLSINQIENVKEQAYGGYPSALQNVCKVYPITMGEMLEMGSLQYSSLLGLLLLTEDQIQKILKDKLKTNKPIEKINPLVFLVQSAAANKSFFVELKAAFYTFIKEEIQILPKINSVLVGSMVERRLITQDNFEDFQTILNIQNRREVPTPAPENESEFAKKMRLAAELRDKIKKKQQAQNGENQSLVDLLEIAETFGIDYKNKSIYAFYGLIQRHQRKEKWEQDIQMLCAGADSKKVKAEYWGINSKK